MNDSTGAACAADAVRCLYLAGVAKRLGHSEGARRWREKADRWLETIGLRRQESGTEASNGPDTAHQLH